MGELYSTSKKTSRVWDGNNLGLLKCTSTTFVSNFFENKNLSAIMTYDINMEAQHLFNPGVYDRVLPTDDLEEDAVVAGNAVDKLGQLMPMKTQSTVLNHVPAVIRKSKAHPVFSQTPILPKTHLKGTTWDKEEEPLILILVPTAMPLPFGVTIPYGNLADAEFMHGVKRLGVEYEYHAEAIYAAMKHHQEVDKVVQSIVAKQQEDTYMPGYDQEKCNVAPYVQLSLLRDDQECPGAMEDISAVFGVKKTSSTAAPPALMPTQTFVPQTIVLTKPKDDEKKKLEEMNCHRLGIFFASDTNTSFEKGAANFENGLMEPQWSDSFEEILEMKGDSRTSILVDFVEDIFTSSVGVEVDIFQEKSAITDAASFMFLPKNAAAQILKGNFCTENISSDLKEKCDLTLATFLHQENSNNKVVLLKEKEIQAQAEIDYDVPENQRSRVESSITVPGSLFTFQHVVGLVANCLKIWTNFVQKAFKKGDLMPVIVTCYMAMFSCLTDATTKRWVKEHEASSPHFIIWLWNVLQSIYICAAKATKEPANMSACRKNQFGLLNKGPFKQMIYITSNAIEKIAHWVMLDTGCDIIPRNTPLAMNPEAMERKRYQDQITALERQIGSGRFDQTSNQNAGGNAVGQNGGTRASANTSSDAAIKRMKTNSSVAAATLTNNSKKGSFVENPAKPPITASALFTGYDLPLAEMHCFHFHMFGKECTRHNCTHRHTPLTKMDPGEREKILEHIAKTQCVFINPALRGNKTLMALITPEKQDRLFPPTTGASN